MDQSANIQVSVVFRDQRSLYYRRGWIDDCQVFKEWAMREFRLPYGLTEMKPYYIYPDVGETRVKCTPARENGSLIMRPFVLFIVEGVNPVYLVFRFDYSTVPRSRFSCHIL